MTTFHNRQRAEEHKSVCWPSAIIWGAVVVVWLAIAALLTGCGGGGDEDYADEVALQHCLNGRTGKADGKQDECAVELQTVCNKTGAVGDCPEDATRRRPSPPNCAANPALCM